MEKRNYRALLSQKQYLKMLIAVLTMLTSTIEAFRMPAGSAITPLLLEPSHYTLGKAASYSFSRVSQLLGYVVSGGLIVLIGLCGVRKAGRTRKC